MRRAALVLAILLACAGAAYAREGAWPLDIDHFDNCAPPVRPACLDNPKTFESDSAIRACESDMRRFIAYVHVYRSCMYRRIERVLQSTNAASALFKCRTSHQPDCS